MELSSNIRQLVDKIRSKKESLDSLVDGNYYNNKNNLSSCLNIYGFYDYTILREPIIFKNYFLFKPYPYIFKNYLCFKPFVFKNVLT